MKFFFVLWLFFSLALLTLSHFSCFFFGGGGGVYITREFDRFLHRGNTKILTAKFVSLGDVFILQFSKLIKAFP